MENTTLIQRKKYLIKNILIFVHRINSCSQTFSSYTCCYVALFVFFLAFKMRNCSHLIATVVHKDFQHRRLLSTRVQWRQIIQGGIYWSISPVFKLAWQMTNFLIFDLTSNNVLKHLGEYREADLLTPDKHFSIIILLCRNGMMRTCYVDIT